MYSEREKKKKTLWHEQWRRKSSGKPPQKNETQRIRNFGCTCRIRLRGTNKTKTRKKGSEDQQKIFWFWKKNFQLVNRHCPCRRSSPRCASLPENPITVRRAWFRNSVCQQSNKKIQLHITYEFNRYFSANFSKQKSNKKTGRILKEISWKRQQEFQEIQCEEKTAKNFVKKFGSR